MHGPWVQPVVIADKGVMIMCTQGCAVTVTGFTFTVFTV
jgi:hypothetical protein